MTCPLFSLNCPLLIFQLPLSCPLTNIKGQSRENVWWWFAYVRYYSRSGAWKSAKSPTQYTHISRNCPNTHNKTKEMIDWKVNYWALKAARQTHTVARTDCVADTGCLLQYPCVFPFRSIPRNKHKHGLYHSAASALLCSAPDAECWRPLLHQFLDMRMPRTLIVLWYLHMWVQISLFSRRIVSMCVRISLLLQWFWHYWVHMPLFSYQFLNMWI